MNMQSGSLPDWGLLHGFDRHALATRIGAAFEVILAHDDEVEARDFAGNFLRLEPGARARCPPLLAFSVVAAVRVLPLLAHDVVVPVVVGQGAGLRFAFDPV